MVLKSVGILSMAKMMAVLYAVMGFIMGCFMSLVAIAGVAAANNGQGAGMGMMFGAGAIIILPIFYGLMGFIGGIIGGALYNFAASVMGGIEMNFAPSVEESVAPQPQGNW